MLIKCIIVAIYYYYYSLLLFFFYFVVVVVVRVWCGVSSLVVYYCMCCLLSFVFFWSTNPNQTISRLSLSLYSEHILHDFGRLQNTAPSELRNELQ